ncbi:MAG: N-6 DNA methylase [Bacteroidetes bacterium]|nr:N-6 DNA methylase [Bacteroidota bacterium]
MPVEVLGNAYEQFLGKVIRINKAHHAVIEEKPEVRKAGGVFYTPQYIVDYIVENTVGKLIAGKTPKEIEKIKIVDPACGSGSFLLGAFDYLLKYHQNYYHKNPPTAKSGIITPVGTISTAEKKKILLNNIYGVDLDANAVEVSKLSLLLKCMEGETEASIKQQITMFNERVTRFR